MVLMKKMLSVATAFCVLSTSAVAAFGAIKTDKTQYKKGDVVNITGDSTASEVMLKVLSQNSSLVYLDNPQVVNGYYTDTFKIGNNFLPGLYTIVAGNGANTQNTQITITDESSTVINYNPGNTVTLTGNWDGAEVLLKVIGPTGSVIYINTVKTESGAFKDQFNLASDAQAGTYTVVYGSETTVQKYNFTVTQPDPNPNPNPNPDPKPNPTPITNPTTNSGDNQQQQESEPDKAADKAVKDLGDKPDNKAATEALNKLVNTGVTPAKAAETVASIVSKTPNVDQGTLKAAADFVNSSTTLEVKKETVNTNDLTNAVDALVKVSKLADGLKTSLALTVKLDESAGAKPDAGLDGEQFRKLQSAGVKLKLQGTDAVVQIPSSAIDSAALAAAKTVKVSKTTLSGDSAKAIEDKATSVDPAIKPLGGVFSLELSTVDSNGNTETVLAFKDKVTVRLTLPQAAVNTVKDKRKVGVYCFKGDGSTEFKNGKLDGNTIDFTTTHFSNYVVAEYDKSFDDVKDGLWSKDYVEVLAARHITSGVDKAGKNFAPTANVTRAEFAAFIVRALGIDTTDYKGTFKDVTSDKWYAKEVEAAKAAGLVDGTGTDAFAPDAQITREQMAKMIVNAVELKTGKKLSDLSGAYTGKLTDLDKASSWATDYIKAANALEIVGGNPDGSYKPTDKAQRQQIAKVIVDMLTKSGLI